MDEEQLWHAPQYNFEGIDKDLVDLIRGMLRYSPRERITAREAAQHPAFDNIRRNPHSAYNRTMRAADTPGSL